jgi:hypothetical protein
MFQEYFMSKLKISDLSFCETELSNSSQVQGGLTISLTSITSLKPISITTDSRTGNRMTYYSTTNGDKYFLTTDSTGKLLCVGGAKSHISVEGNTTITTSSAFAVSGDLVDLVVSK